MSTEITEKKIKGYEQNRKLQIEVIKNLQILVDHSEKEKENMAEEIKEKDHIIYMLKQKGDNVCSNGCGKYTKSMDDVVKATVKHREAAITLKEICEKQKVKIKEYVEEIDKYELELTEQEEKTKQLEEDVEIGFDMNNRKRKEIENLQVAKEEYKKKVEDMEDTVSRLEKKKEISDNVIKKLQGSKEIQEMKSREAELSMEAKLSIVTTTAQKNEGEVQKLMKEINSILKVNRIKEELLERISKEKEEILENLRVQEGKLEEFKEKNSVEEIALIEVSSLSNELGINDPRASNSTVGRNNKTFAKKNFEVQRKEIEVLETKICNQKMKLTASLLKLKEKELKEKYLCHCKYFCLIHHLKHNWQKSKSTDLFLKFEYFSFQDTLIQDKFACDQCKHMCDGLDSLKKHVEATHKGNSVFEREDKMEK